MARIDDMRERGRKKGGVSVVLLWVIHTRAAISFVLESRKILKKIRFEGWLSIYFDLHRNLDEEINSFEAIIFRFSLLILIQFVASIQIL